MRLFGGEVGNQYGGSAENRKENFHINCSKHVIYNNQDIELAWMLSSSWYKRFKMYRVEFYSTTMKDEMPFSGSWVELETLLSKILQHIFSYNICHHSRGVGLERTELTKVSCNIQLYSESQTIYTLRVKRGPMRKALMSSRSQGQVSHSKNHAFT